MRAIPRSPMRRAATCWIRDATRSPEDAVLTLEKCIDLSDFAEEEIDAIGEHEHIVAIMATEVGSNLFYLPKRRRPSIRDDILAAWARAGCLHSAKPKLVLPPFTEHRYENSALCGPRRPAAPDIRSRA